MVIIPVLDVKGGVAVHAVGGHRAHYRPLRSRLHPEADPLGIARAFRDKLGLTALYLADLDAIGGAAPALRLYEALRDLGLDLWVDAGLRNAGLVDPLTDSGVVTIVAGSETVAGPPALAEIVAHCGPERTVFSLDMDTGRPRLAAGANWGGTDPPAVVARAVRAGVGRLLLLDLERVGTGRGPGTLPLLQELRAKRDIAIAVGGGIARAADVESAARAGASAVLVGSALHSAAILIDRGRAVDGAP